MLRQKGSESLLAFSTVSLCERAPHVMCSGRGARRASSVRHRFPLHKAIRAQSRPRRGVHSQVVDLAPNTLSHLFLEALRTVDLVVTPVPVEVFSASRLFTGPHWGRSIAIPHTVSSLPYPILHTVFQFEVSHKHNRAQQYSCKHKKVTPLSPRATRGIPHIFYIIHRFEE